MQMSDLVRMQRDEEPEEVVDGKVDCSTCQGTGLPTSGPIDQGRCWDCKGRGWHRVEDDDYGEGRRDRLRDDWPSKQPPTQPRRKQWAKSQT